MHFQPHDRDRVLFAPVLGRLPAKVPYAHAFVTISTHAEFVFRSLRAITIDLPVIYEDPNGGTKMLRSAGTSRTDTDRTQRGQLFKLPSPHGNPQSLHPFGTVHDQYDLRCIRPEMRPIENLFRLRKIFVGQVAVEMHGL